MGRQRRTHIILAATGLICASGSAISDPATALNVVQVTATRDPEPVDQVPASISVVTGAQLRARGANDLRTALSLTAGVEGTPGGDSGPAGAVPALWGLREADAFLLVVDGVPWGGAFNPATPSIDLAGVERIEILRGAAPVMFGATSFVGVIHVIHFAAGESPSTISIGGGSYGSYGLAGSTNLPPLGDFRQSLAVNLEQRGYDSDRAAYSRYHALYRGATDLGSARFHLDADVSILPQAPAGNLLLRDGTVVHRELPIYANFNPANAGLDQQRYSLSAGLDGENSLGNWSASLAVTRTGDRLLRGFLRGRAFSDPPDAGVGDGLQADGYDQRRWITDLYFDAHATTDLSTALKLTYGVDYLYGTGSQRAANFGYCIDPGGRELSCPGARHDDELARSEDSRDFAGVYSQVEWMLSPVINVMAGLRLNHTSETASGRAVDNTGPVPVIVFEGTDKRAQSRLSGMLGATWRAWSAGSDELTVYADYRNSYKPLAIDFGPEAEVEVLEPETGSSYEAGARVRLAQGRLEIDTSAFHMDFRNGLTYADDGSGNFLRANGGEIRFEGIELEARYLWTEHLQVLANYANHDARFIRYTRDNGADASGNRFEMSPRHLGGVGLVYAASSGFGGSLVANYTGSRMLNKSNSVEAGGYGTFDASLNLSVGKYRIQLSAQNLTDRRDPVSESELSEAVTATGTAAYYRLPGRRLEFMVSFNL
jgi:iron complex outermembrane recepter protein